MVVHIAKQQWCVAGEEHCLDQCLVPAVRERFSLPPSSRASLLWAGGGQSRAPCSPDLSSRSSVPVFDDM